MKINRRNFSQAIILSIVLCMINVSLNYGQTTKEEKEATVGAMVEAGSFVFKVQSVSPRRGGIVQESPGYNVSVSKDTVTCYLPYIGRAYQAGYGSDNGLKFTSTKFQYKQESKKKGGWSISIKYDDSRSVRQMTFNVSKDGSTWMSVVCNDRESISYNGYLESKSKN